MDIVTLNTKNQPCIFFIFFKFFSVYQVTLGMKFLHSQNIIHRDLASRNILIGQKEPLVAKVADFGMSRILLESSTYYSSTFTLPVRWFAFLTETLIYF